MLAIIPARAGSKGVPGKNRRDFYGKPLIQWSLDAAKEAKSIEEVVISTDDSLILNNPIFNSSCDIMLSRPNEMSQDDSPATLYIKHAIEFTKAWERHEYICILQPTSPLRVSEDIDLLYTKVIDSKLNSGVTVVQVPHNFAPQSLMEKKGDYLELCTDSLNSRNLRQEKKSFLARNGAAVYICKIEHFIKSNSLFDKTMAYHEMSMIRSIDIDTEDDFKLAELIKKEYS